MPWISFAAKKELGTNRATRSTTILLEKLHVNEDGYVDFLLQDPDNPQSFSLRRKYWITGVAIVLVMNATFSSSAPTAVVRGIAKDLNVSTEAAGLVTTCFLLGYVAGPLLWAPLSEFYG